MSDSTSSSVSDRKVSTIGSRDIGDVSFFLSVSLSEKKDRSTPGSGEAPTMFGIVQEGRGEDEEDEDEEESCASSRCSSTGKRLAWRIR